MTQAVVTKRSLARAELIAKYRAAGFTRVGWPEHDKPAGLAGTLSDQSPDIGRFVLVEWCPGYKRLHLTTHESVKDICGTLPFINDGAPHSADWVALVVYDLDTGDKYSPRPTAYALDKHEAAEAATYAVCGFIDGDLNRQVV